MVRPCIIIDVGHGNTVTIKNSRMLLMQTFSAKAHACAMSSIGDSAGQTNKTAKTAVDEKNKETEHQVEIGKSKEKKRIEILFSKTPQK